MKYDVLLIGWSVEDASRACLACILTAQDEDITDNARFELLRIANDLMNAIESVQDSDESEAIK